MPTYGYRCDDCGHEFEVFQSMSAAPLTECPECGGRLQKMLYPVGVHFKGSGFYTTDYKTGANSGPKGDGKAESGDGSRAEAGKSEASKSDSGSGKSESGPAKSEPAKGEASKPESSTKPAERPAKPAPAAD